MDKVVSIKLSSGGYTNKKVLKSLNIDFDKGKFIAIVGPNGSGKSTLLKYIIRELETKDPIFLVDKDISQLNQNQIAQRISFVGQNNKLDYEFTVKELVQMGRYCHKDEISNQDEALKALEQVGITDLSDKLVTQISGGELQLAMLARAVCQQSPVMALDEPVNNLDPSHEIKLLNLLKTLSEEGKTVICVLHDLNAVLNYCDECIIIKDGQITASGKTQDVLTEENIKTVYGLESKIISLSHDQRLLTFCCNR